MRSAFLCLFLSAALCLSPPATAGDGPIELDIFSDQLSNELATLSYDREILVHGLTLGASGPAETLRLQRFDVFADGAEVLVHGKDGLNIQAPPRHRYFRGEIADKEGSRAFLSLRENGELSGLVGYQGRFYRLASPAVRTSGEALLAEYDLSTAAAPTGREPFACGTNNLRDPDAFDRLPRSAPARSAMVRGGTATYFATIAIATDYELFQRFTDVNEMMTYIGDLFAYISGIYETEVDAQLVVGDTDVWTVPEDPFESTSTGCQLSEFGRYWNTNFSDRTYTLAHFLSGKNAGGGIAWLGVLCAGGWERDADPNCPELGMERDLYGGPFGVSAGITGSFNPGNPSVVWDMVVIAHELGHNFASPHTHCYNGVMGNPEPVDKCFEEGGGCYAGPTSLPCETSGAGCATIMSYCHLLSGGLSNISPTFGLNHGFGDGPDRVPAVMNAHVMETAAGDPSCLPQACSPPVISAGPASTNACFGDVVTFSVQQSAGTAFQWRKDAVSLEGETGATLTLTVSDPSAAGNYSCIVSNTCDSVESDSALLTLDGEFSASMSPNGRIVQGRNLLTFAASITCNPNNLTWTWQESLQGNVLGQNTTQLTLPARLTQTTTISLRVQHNNTLEVLRDSVEVLAAQDDRFDDLNGDGCNTIDDMLFLCGSWRTLGADADGNGVIDVRDFLFVNTDQTGCP